uniref:Uncharacterized protein n=1 Tax=Harveyella mirabilis TaxID=282355 RepID=A0A3S8UW32_9FLOR|nr:hypothetical protein [Harveyella mirabilis]
MILSNSILLYKILKSYYVNKQDSILTQYQDNSKNLFNYISNKFSQVFILNSKYLINQVKNKSKHQEKNNKLIAQNFWKVIFNKYLQEIVYLSPSNFLSKIYIDKLNGINLSINKKDEYIIFLDKFSRKLVSGNIPIFSNIKNDRLISLFNIDNIFFLKYNWLKIFNCKLFILQNCFNNWYFQLKKKIDIRKKQSLLIFILINNKNEMILSESFQEFNQSNNLLDLNSEIIKKNISLKKKYLGLVFINPKDGLEYQKYINSKYCSSTSYDKIQLVSINMNFYLRFLNFRIPNFELRLIPDLKEISNLIYTYKKFNNLFLDKYQNIGKHHFQGQPIYIIKSIEAKSKKNNYSKIFNYLLCHNKDNYSNKNQILFLNYKTAINAWKKNIEKNKNYYLPIRPFIHVLNLETFLKTSYYRKNNNKIIFVPSVETYKFIKEYFKLDIYNSKNTYYLILNHINYIKTFCHRVIWYLTSQ